MKKMRAIAITALLSLPMLANSTGTQSGLSTTTTEKTQAIGGFTGPTIGLATVERAKRMRDGEEVVLQGYIDQHLGGENYQFRDATSSIVIEVDRKKWDGQEVGPKDKIEILGEVDKDWNSVEIEVKRLVKL